jgi:hypothetical protein
MGTEEQLEEIVQDQTIKVNLVGLKYMKSQKIWRFEFDVYEEENPKVKSLMDQINKDFYLALVPLDNKQDNA